jgi:hypothetical protein
MYDRYEVHSMPQHDMYSTCDAREWQDGQGEVRKGAGPPGLAGVYKVLEAA